MERALRPPLFIVGSGRSGTTILSRSLSGREYASLPIEPRLFCDTTGAIRSLPMLERPSDHDALTAYLISRYLFTSRHGPAGFFQIIDRDQFDRAISRVGSSDLSPCQVLARLHHDLLQRPLRQSETWIDDTPTNAFVMNDIVSVFPDAKFIHLIRDGRDVAESFVRAGWAQNSHDKGLAMWVSHLRAARAHGSLMRRDQYLEVSFDAVVRDTRCLSICIADFLDADVAADIRTAMKSSRAGRFVKQHSPKITRSLLHIAPDLCFEFGWA
ncbi:MAG: sulfotransferase [Rhizobiaceae bacterium]|nr:sulfotransferase [Rhizobiaceae bacterium]